jgi:FkbM family methyltransferase
MTGLRFLMSGLLKERILARYRIPFSRSGLDGSLVSVLSAAEPVTVVDVGASTGGFLDAVIAYCGVRKAWLIEPQPARCRELEDKYQGRGFTVFAGALSDYDGVAPMDILNFDYSSSLLRPTRDAAGSAEYDLGVRERIQVPVQTLDGLLAGAALAEPIDLLKIDVQGNELRVLRGARQSLPRTRLIWVEVSFRPLYEGSAVFSEVYDFLHDHGFYLGAIQEGFRGHGGELLQADALFLANAAKQS